MDKQKAKSLIDALSYCRVTGLPEECDKDVVWLTAIALVSKIDGSESYALVVRDDEKNYHVVKDFGTMSATVKVEHIYPIDVLSEGDMPYFSTKGKEERIKWLASHNVQASEDMSVKELNVQILRYVINRHVAIAREKI